MMDVTVKTLDGQNRSFCVPENITVKQFKEKIANSISIPADTQRLIFQGRVLQDDKPLKDYDVHGKVLHVVLRPPPSMTPNSTTDTGATGTSTNANGQNIFVRSFTLPSEILDPGRVQDIVQDALGSMGDVGRNARVTTRTSPDGSSVDVHIHLGRSNRRQESEAQLRINQARRMITLATETLNQLENPRSNQNSSTPTPGPDTEDNQSTDVSMDTSDDQPSTSQSQPPEEKNDQSEAKDSATGTASTGTESEADGAGGRPESPVAAGDQSEGAGEEEQADQEGAGQQQGLVRPNISVLAEVLDEVQSLNRRFLPHFQRCRDIVARDEQMDQAEAREAQRTCNMVADLMHSISHCYHCLSDLVVDMSQPPPRQLYVTLAIAHPHTTVIQQTIPMQAQINVGGSPGPIRRLFGGIPNANSTPPQFGVPPASTQAPTSAAPGAPGQPRPAGEPRVPPTAAPGAPQPPRSTAEQPRVPPGAGVGVGAGAGNLPHDNPYVFVEMGPETVTVNSISAHVVTTTEPVGSASSSPSSAGSTPGPNITQASMVPPDLIPGLLQSILQSTGSVAGTPPQSVQINMGTIRPGEAPTFMQMPGLQGMGGPRGPFGPVFPFGPQAGVRPPGTTTEAGGGNRPSATAGSNTGSGNQTQASGSSAPGAGSRPGASSTSGTQTARAETSSSETQTQAGSAPNRQTPSSNTGTQTADGGAARRAEILLPGLLGVQGLGGQIPGLGGQIPGLGGQIPGLGGQIPGLGGQVPGLGGQPGLNPLDPYLPCSSRHFLTRQTRNLLGNQARPQVPVTGLGSAAPGATGSSSTSSTTTVPPAATQAGQPRPMAAPGSGATPRAGFQFLPGQQMAFMPGVGVRLVTPLNSTVTAPSTGQAQSTPAGGAPPAAGEPPFVQALRTMLQGATPRPATSTTNTVTPTPSTGQTPGPVPTPSTAPTPAPAPVPVPVPGTTTDQNQNVQAAPRAMTDEAFTQLVSGISGFMSQAAMGQAPQQSITDFLGSLGENYGVAMGEGFINDILNCVLSNLQITDLIQVFCGIPGPLANIHAPLRQYIRDQVLQGQEGTEQNVRTNVERLMSGIQDDIREIVELAETHPGIDFQQTLNSFLSQQMQTVISFILSTQGSDANFPVRIYEIVRGFFMEFVVLCTACLTSGLPAFRSLLADRMRHMTSGVNPLIQQWMVGMTERHLEQFLPAITVQESQIQRYIKRRPAEAKESARKAADQSAPMESSPSSSPGATSHVKMETEASKAEVLSREAGPASAQRKEAPAERPQGAVPTVNGSVSPSPQQSGDGDWRSVIPQDWIPVIERDVETQKTQKSQKPHSDTYLQGMPPKRRRMMTHDRAEDMSNAAEVLPESIRRAVAAADVEPISSVENLSNEAVNNTDLQTAFQDQVQCVVSQRLQSDSDYAPERFPNSDHYLQKKSEPKK